MKNSFTYDRAWTIYKKYILPAYFVFLAVFLIAAVAKFNEADGGEQAVLQNTACSGKRILFISSYTDDFPTVALQKKGISEVFDSVNNIQIDTQYMDMKNYDTTQNENNFYVSLKYKLTRCKKYDLILLGDDSALRFAVKHQEELFKNTPMVFFCVNDLNTARSAGDNPYITGIVEELYIRETLAIATKMQPKAKQIIGIYDDTPTGYGDLQQFMALEKTYPEYTFKTIDTSLCTWKQYAEQLEALGDDTILLYMDSFTDVNGNSYTMNEGIRYTVAHAHIPIYRSSHGGVGDGFLGGKMVSYEESGKSAAMMARSILSGTDITTIPIRENGDGKYYFDNKIIQKYHIDRRMIPTGAVIINAGESFFVKYKKYMMLIIIVSLVLFIVVLTVLWDNIRQRHYRKELESKEAHIRYQAEHDYLTGLPNRQSAIFHLSSLLEKKSSVSLIALDVDDFKGINDSIGHAFGDAVLIEIGERLDRMMKKMDIFASRFGGDEFLLITSVVSPEETSLYVNRVRQELGRPFLYHDQVHLISTSMGVASSVNGEYSAPELLANADLAMYACKHSGKNKYAYFDNTMKNNMLKKNEIIGILQKACREDGFEILYQPQVDIYTGKVAGFEALLRLKDHSYAPGQFIPVAEGTELIQSIGRIVTQKVVRQIAKWQDSGIVPLPVSINFSSRQMADTGYVSYLQGLLRKYNVASKMIEIEITESILLENNDKAMKLFADFRKIGVGLTLDDFGTGYSSISYLTYIPVEKIKIDKTLTDTYLQEGKDDFIGILIELAHCLDMKITVEGIEEQNQLSRLQKYGCDYVQGYYFCRPVPEDVAVKQIAYSIK